MSKIKRNLFYVFLAQLITLIVSSVTSIGGALIFGKEMQGFWQLFLFYLSYIGFFHFGWIDGIYLKLGGKHASDLDTKSLQMQFFTAIGLFTIVAIFVMLYAFNFQSHPMRQFILYLFAVNIVIANAMTFLTVILQTINQIKDFTFSILIEKIFFIVAIGLLLLIRNFNVVYYMLALTISRAIALVYLIFKMRFIIFSKQSTDTSLFLEIKDNVKVGIHLMLANIAGSFIIGVSRFIVDFHWGETVFGEVSLALSLVNFFLLFISQASIVLFPSLRQTNSENLNQIYIKLNKYITAFLWGILIFYPVGKFVMIKIIPNYAISIYYLGILLPIVVFESKMQLIFNTYFKVLRKERTMFFINAIMVIVSMLLAILAVNLKNIQLIIIFIVVTLGIRCFIGNYLIDRYLKLSTLKFLIIDIILSSMVWIVLWFIQHSILQVIILMTFYGVIYWIEKKYYN